MLLTEPEIEQVLEQVKNSFPHFTDWEYNNEKNQQYFGFSVWGKFVVKTKSIMPQTFYITLDQNHEDKWEGCLTIGQHSFLWFSADVGDAHLVNTAPCDSLEQAITELKTKMGELFTAFSAI